MDDIRQIFLFGKAFQEQAREARRQRERSEREFEAMIRAAKARNR